MVARPAMKPQTHREDLAAVVKALQKENAQLKERLKRIESQYAKMAWGTFFGEDFDWSAVYGDDTREVPSLEIRRVCLAVADAALAWKRDEETPFHLLGEAKLAAEVMRLDPYKVQREILKKLRPPKRGPHRSRERLAKEAYGILTRQPVDSRAGRPRGRVKRLLEGKTNNVKR